MGTRQGADAPDHRAPIGTVDFGVARAVLEQSVGAA
jgi:hypothetical protein